MTTRVLTPISFFGQIYFINCFMIAQSVAFLSFTFDAASLSCFAFAIAVSVAAFSVGLDVNTRLGMYDMIDLDSLLLSLLLVYNSGLLTMCLFVRRHLLKIGEWFILVGGLFIREQPRLFRKAALEHCVLILRGSISCAFYAKSGIELTRDLGLYDKRKKRDIAI